jgi:hypothetical protein
LGEKELGSASVARSEPMITRKPNLLPAIRREILKAG